MINIVNKSAVNLFDKLKTTMFLVLLNCSKTHILQNDTCACITLYSIGMCASL